MENFTICYLIIGMGLQRVSIFEFGMPPMVFAGVLVIIGGLSPRLTATLVGFGVIMSFVILPVLYCPEKPGPLDQDSLLRFLTSALLFPHVQDIT
ncbi:MAG: hypothetical protein JRD93_06410 [Deltaproteobacteria bacterium]|nr:hypothetical protein [Deltaproteobacteria bacterium]MBW2661609.1 hypothetical protein [Deltaproteobacteria bacterium]